MKRIALLPCLVVSHWLYAEDSRALSDSLRAEIAIAQRNYLIAKQELENAYGAVLMTKGNQASAECKKSGLVFDAISITCQPDSSAKTPTPQPGNSATK